MSAITELLKNHPQAPHAHFDLVADCVAACFECEQVCVACADACLGEENVAEFRQCIRLNLDCADVCAATGRLVSRQAEPDADLWRAILETCAQACRSCAAECARHADRHEHTRVCKEVCERTERACSELLDATPTGGHGVAAH